MLPGKWTCLALILLVSFSFVLTSGENDFDEDDLDSDMTRKKSRRRTTRKPRNKRTRRPRRPKPAAEQASPSCPSYGAEPASKEALSTDTKDLILTLVNAIRYNVKTGNGQVKGADNQVLLLPGAENLEPLQWNNDLATDAETWADLCAVEKQEEPPKQTFDRVYQLFFTKTTEGQIGWAGAIETIGKDGPDNYEETLKQIGNYTAPTIKTEDTLASDNFLQILWAKSTEIGCGYGEYFKATEDGGKSANSTEVFVCNFGPGGNREGEPVYIEKSDEFICPEPDSDSDTVTEVDKNTIVNTLNYFRTEVSKGAFTIKTDDNPELMLPAGNIPKLKWDEDLASDAQSWADTCANKKNRAPPSQSYEQVNQILYQCTGPERSKKLWLGVFITFYEEGTGAFTIDVIDKYHRAKYDVLETSRVTQAFWANSTSIGCGYSEFSKCIGQLTQNFVCNFGPGGNIDGQKMYIKNGTTSA